VQRRSARGRRPAHPGAHGQTGSTGEVGGLGGEGPGVAHGRGSGLDGHEPGQGGVLPGLARDRRGRRVPPDDLGVRVGGQPGPLDALAPAERIAFVLTTRSPPASRRRGVTAVAVERPHRCGWKVASGDHPGADRRSYDVGRSGSLAGQVVGVIDGWSQR
jgi:hypothetical protein